MCYLVSGINSRLNNERARAHAIYDTEEEARAEAEKLIRINYTDVAVWKQIATPSIETIIKWEGQPSNG